MPINVHFPLRHLEKKTLEDHVKIQFRVANLQPNQSKLGTSHHPSLHKVGDIAHILEIVHEFSKILGLMVARKHGIIYHGQGTIAEVEKLSSLGSSILKLDNTATASLVRPKINVIGSGKTKKALNPQIHPLFLSGSIQKRTYERQGEKVI
jgi:hypothetical protein